MKKFRDFESAREFTQKLGLKNREEWRQYCKSGNKPDEVPNRPDATYKNEWKGMGDWLGTGKTRNTKFRPYKEAREFARALNLKSLKEWTEYCKSGNKPDDIPVNPHYTYKKDFKGVGDWLGTGNVAAQDKVYRLYKEAREFVQKLELGSRAEWYEYCKSGNKPDDIPYNLNQTYKKEWKSWGFFLGTNFVSYQDRVYRQFTEAREFARSLGLKNREEWMEYCNSGNKPNDIATSPRNSYKKEWKDWGDWLGTEKKSYQNITYRSFTEAREYVRNLNLKNRDEWRQFTKSKQIPDDIPKFPEGKYEHEWKGIGNWLGTGVISSIEQSKKWLPFKEAKIEAQKIAKKLGISNNGEWVKAHKDGKIPDFLPRYPRDIYKKDKK